jgi:hypothetical protein
LTTRKKKICQKVKKTKTKQKTTKNNKKQKQKMTSTPPNSSSSSSISYLPSTSSSLFDQIEQNTIVFNLNLPFQMIFPEFNFESRLERTIQQRREMERLNAQQKRIQEIQDAQQKQNQQLALVSNSSMELKRLLESKNLGHLHQSLVLNGILSISQIDELNVSRLSEIQKEREDLLELKTISNLPDSLRKIRERSDLKINFNELTEIKPLSERGCFGDILIAKYRSSRVVLKRLFDHDFNSFYREVEILA